MSIRLHTGFVFTDRNIDIHAALAIIDRWRATFRNWHRQELAALIARDATEFIDTEALRDLFPGTPERIDAPASTARDRIRARQKDIRATGLRDPQVDFDFSLSLHPHQDGLYGLVFSERQNWIDSFLESAEITRLPYWDNTDRPEHLDAAQWAARGDLWKSILDRDPSGRPAQAGFTAEMSPADTLGPPIEDLVDAQPTLDRRIELMAQHLYVDREIIAIHGVDGAPPIATISRIHCEITSEAGRGKLQQLRSEIAPRLKDRLERDDFLGRVTSNTG